jgi:hypothetical protein
LKEAEINLIVHEADNRLCQRLVPAFKIDESQKNEAVPRCVSY